MDKPKGYVDAAYLEVVGDIVRRHKEHTYELMRLRPGDRVLDVGCGSGIDTLAMARRVGPAGHVTGVDYDPEMIAIADREAEKAGVRPWVAHQQAEASALPFESSAFDACRSERLFIHLVDPQRALSEMVRVTKPGGWVVVFDPDWGTQSIDTSEVDIERRLARVHAERMNNGYSGRQLYRLFKQQKLGDLSLEVLASSWVDYALTRRIFKLDEVEQDALEGHIVTEEELRRWRAARFSVVKNNALVLAMIYDEKAHTTGRRIERDGVPSRLSSLRLSTVLQPNPNFMVFEFKPFQLTPQRFHGRPWPALVKLAA